jgi:hypothetical protein
MNGMLNAIDQGVHVMNFDSEIMNVSDDEKDAQTPRMFNSPKKQIHVFEDDNAYVGTTPYVNFDSPRTRASKLPSV